MINEGYYYMEYMWLEFIQKCASQVVDSKINLGIVLLQKTI